MKLSDPLPHATAWVLMLLFGLGALALWLVDPVPMQSLRLAQFDQFQRWRPHPTTPSLVRVVDIDEASLQAYGQWPWPRTRMAELVQRLHASGPVAIALDVLLAEPDRTSPQTMAQLWNHPQASTLLQGLPDHDAVLATTLAGRGVVLGRSLSNRVDGQDALAAQPLNPPPALPYRVVHQGDGTASRWLQGFDTAVSPLPRLEAAAAGVGALNMAADRDGIVRRVPLFLQWGAHTVPTLSAEVLRVAQGARNYLLRSSQAGVQDVRIGPLLLATNAQAEIWLHHSAEPPPRFLSAAQVLGSQVPADALRGHIVLIGSSAAGLSDLHPNPMGHLMPGVQAHALALEQLLSGQHLQRPAWASGLEALALLLGALLVGLVALRTAVWCSALVAAGVLAGLCGGAWYAFASHQLLLDAVNPALAIMLSFGLASSLHHFASERERRWVRQAFSRYVSPNRVANLMKHPEQLQLGGQRQVCSFVFTDLADSTHLMENCDPAQLVTLFNQYLEGMLRIVFRHEGTLDRIMGDAVVVLFSAPVPQADHRQRALDCALEMDAFAVDYAQRLQASGVPWGHTRIGVHSGEVIVGNFGGKTMFDYRALGDPVNTAARLESVNRHLGTRVCVSQAIVDGCTGQPLRAVGRLMLKGKSQPLTAYEPVAASDAAACASPADYGAAMRLLQSGEAQQAHKALALFSALAQRHPNDPLVALHLQRLRLGASDDLIVLLDK